MFKGINIAFAVNNKYSPYLEIALYSLLLHNNKSKFEINVLSFDIDRSNKDKLSRICEHFGNASINFILLESNYFENLKTHAHFSRDIYTRYILADLLPDKDKILYLDADILVTRDISELYKVDISGYFIAAVIDKGIQKEEFAEYLSLLGIYGFPYYNSGVLLMNLAKIREDGMAKKLIDKTSDLADKLQHPDQDVINIVFKDHIKKLSSVWNYQDEDRRIKEVDLNDVGIVHYTSGYKPWNTPNAQRGYNKISHELYDQYRYNYMELFYNPELVSVIIPVYNTSKRYIDECIDSLLSQNYRNIEIIIIDDGSKESIANRLDELAVTDTRIRVIHKENAGSNRAREVGFKESSGKYITFIDSDDSVSPNYIYKLYMSLTQSKADISMCESWDETIRPMENNLSSLNGMVINNKDDIIKYVVMGFPEFRVNGGVIWAKLYERGIIESVDWDMSDYMLTEDEFMAIQVFSVAKKISLVGEQLYYYRRHVADSKESRLPVYNKYKGKQIPMIQTASDLYERSIEVFTKNRIKYNINDLLYKYIIMLDAQITSICKHDNIGSNREELRRQAEVYIPLIRDNKKLTYEHRIRALFALNMPDLLYIYNSYLINTDHEVNKLHNQNETLIRENNTLVAEVNRLSGEIQSFMSVKRSARLLLGNIKRRFIAR